MAAEAAPVADTVAVAAAAVALVAVEATVVAETVVAETVVADTVVAETVAVAAAVALAAVEATKAADTVAVGVPTADDRFHVPKRAVRTAALASIRGEIEDECGLAGLVNPDLDSASIVLNILLYVLLPLWGVAGLIDWFCHKATNIEETSGLHEALVHVLMGFQVGIPVFLALTFEVNVLVLILCFLALLMHEVVAHYDVHYASPRREISIWEVHAHNYLATLPFFILLLIIVRRWETFVDFITLNWAGNMALEPRQEALGVNGGYALTYFITMGIFITGPYFFEVLRCWQWERANGISTLPWRKTD